MRIKKTGRRGGHRPHSKEPADVTVEEKAARLAPPEEQARRAANGGNQRAGTIVVDEAGVKMPAGFGRAARESRFEINRVVLTVVLLALLFTAFIAWQVTLMPEGDEPRAVRVVGPGEGK
jgi:hypothetical protein